MTWFRSVCYNMRMKIRRLLPIAVLAAAWTTLASSAFAARPAFTVKVASTNAVVAAATDNGLSVVHDGWYYDRDHVAAYIRRFGGLPGNYITKGEARMLGWTGGPLERYAPGKAIGGDRFGNYERRLPQGSWKECDIDTKGRPRGAKRIIFAADKRIYYTEDHYQTFRKLP